MTTTKIIVTLNTSQSKRLIAKSIAVLPEVKRAYKEGVIGLPLCTTNAYVYEELSGNALDSSQAYRCGYISDKGFCITNKENISQEIVLINGNENYIRFPEENLSVYINDMDDKDIIVKSGNILDIDRKAGVLAGETDGGEYGKILPYILSRGIRLIIPMTLNKTAPIRIEEIINEVGLCKISTDYCSRMPCSVLPMFGDVITEIEALDILTSTIAIPIAMSGIGSGEGCTTLLIKGNKTNIEKAYNLLKNIKKEKKVIYKSSNCKKCEKADGAFICPQGKKIKE